MIFRVVCLRRSLLFVARPRRASLLTHPAPLLRRCGVATQEPGGNAIIQRQPAVSEFALDVLPRNTVPKVDLALTPELSWDRFLRHEFEQNSRHVGMYLNLVRRDGIKKNLHGGAEEWSE